MAKFSGVIGYAIQVETVPGVWTDQIVEKYYRGDVLQNMNRWQSSDKVNDDFVIDNKISILSDPFLYENFQHMKYVRWMSTNWKISKIEILRPRVIISIGGVYNGPSP